MKRHGQLCGMTLIEVLVSLGLLSLLSVGILSSFQLGQRSYRRVAHVHAASSGVVSTYRFLRRVLESAYPFEGAAGSQEAAYGLEGERDRLEFTAPMPLAAGTRGYYRYEVTLSGEADGARNLIVRFRLDRNGLVTRTRAFLPQNGGDEILVERVQGIELAYFDSDESNWRTDWKAKRMPPALVRLRVLFAPDDPRRWPELVIAPRVTDDANCEFDLVAQACREARS